MRPIAAVAVQHPRLSPQEDGSRYREIRFLAEGGLGKVFVARDAELPRDVALKRLQDDLARHGESRRRFVIEAEVTARLEHPGVVPVYGLGSERDGQPYYAMRLIQGETLARAVERFHQADVPARDAGERRLALQALLRAFLTACQTIAYAHSRGVIHRDIKPANIMLGAYGETLVVDWGLARPLDASPDDAGPAVDTWAGMYHKTVSATAAGAIKGSPVYMSPEQAEGRSDEIGPASDIYALGATLYTLLAGRMPFDGTTVVEVLTKVRQGRFLPPRRVKPGIPRGLEAVCLKAMALRAGDRYGRALDLAADIERWLSDEPPRAWREPWISRVRRWATRHRTLVAAMLAALVVGAAALAIANGRLRTLATSLDQTNTALATALDASERNLYARNIDVADRAWWDGQHDQTARLLEECPIDRRGWEWSYLARRNRAGLLRAKLDERPMALGFASEGARVVTVGERSVSRIEIATGRWLAPLPHGIKSLRLAATGSDGRRLAYVTAERPGEVAVVDLERPREPARVSTNASPGVIESLAFGPGDRALVWVAVVRKAADPTSNDKVSFLTETEARMVVFDLETGRADVSDPFDSQLAPGAPALDGEGRAFCPVPSRPQSLLFATEPGSRRVTRLWPRGGEDTSDTEGSGMVVSPDGRFFASTGVGNAITVREAVSGKVVATLRGHAAEVSRLLFSPDGSRLASSAGDRTTRVWDLSLRAPAVVMRGRDLDRLAFSVDGRRLVSHDAGALIVHDAENGPEAVVARTPARRHIASVAFSGDRVLAAEGFQAVWRDAETGRELGNPEFGAVFAVAPGGIVAAAGGDGEITLFDRAGQQAGKLRAERSRVSKLAFSRDGRRLAAGHDDGSIRVWNPEKKHEEMSIPTSDDQRVPEAFALSPDGSLLATAGTNRVVVWNVTENRKLLELDRRGSSVRFLEFSPDGQSVVEIDETGNQGVVSLWNVTTGAFKFQLRDHPAPVTAAAFHPDGRRLVTADRSGQARVWEIATGRLLLTLRGPSYPIQCLAFSVDGQRIYAGGGRSDELNRRDEETSELTIWDGRPLGSE